jgi:hypothetical protein
VGIGARLARLGRFVTGAVARLARVGWFVTGAVARVAGASSIGADVVPNVTGRATVAWRVVDRFVACYSGVAWSVKGFVPGRIVAMVAGGEARARFVAAAVRVTRRVVAAVI